MSINNTLRILQDDLLKKSAEVETLQRTVGEQVRTRRTSASQRHKLNGVTRIDHIWFLVAKDQEMASLKTEATSLKAELAKLSLLASTQPRNKKGLLANIKEAVSSPKCTVKRSLRTTARTPHH